MTQTPVDPDKDRKSRKDSKGTVISFHNVNYTVKVKTRGKCCGSATKNILTDVQGLFKPGMNAIMGPTGSGKSSLLDVIAGRKDPNGLSGTLLVNGSPQPKNYKCMSGYVVQDDVVMGTLTVRENIMFSANLRLPTSVSREEKEARVDDCIAELGLEKCADSKVGNEFIRGISGGERKRTNIGMELIVSQAVLFLDEPTTGLDASTANSVMYLLKRLSQSDRTIIFSIHQPRFSIFKQFDRLMLLSQGKTIYHGPAPEALEYFSGIGYECEQHNNPPDFFLDVILGEIPESNTTEHTRASAKVTDDGEDPDKVVDIETGRGKVSKEEAAKALTQELAGKFAQSRWQADLNEELDEIYKTYEDKKKKGEETRIVGEYATSFFSQVATLAGRSIKNIVRNPIATITQTVVLLVFAIVVGLLYLQLGTDLTDIQNRQGAFFFITMNMVFANVSGVAVFIAERVIFVHENVSGFYRISSYFVAKICCDIVPLRIIPLTIYSVVTYFMAGFRQEVGKFFLYFLNLFLISMTAASIAFFASCMTSIFAVANLVTILILVISLVFGGLFVNLKTMGDWLNWIQYISLFRYAMKVFYINEMEGMKFCRKMSNTTEICDTGDHYLEEQGIAHETDWDLWQNVMALIILCVFFMTISYIRLLKMKKLK